jgi:hypothetical protein
MDTDVRNDYIEKALTELIPVLGPKEFVDHQKIISLIHSNKIKEAIKEIALYLGLPIEVNLSYVPRGYRPSNTDSFQSTHLVKTDWRGRGTSGITAQVSIPSNLPFYGTSGLVNFPISVRLSENCTENPMTLISVMAHELSHILLHSLFHKEKENEFYTDLTAMILGFASIMKIGRNVVKTNTSTSYGALSSTTTTHTETTTYGYLSDENFNFAFNFIEDVLNKQKSARKKLLKKLKQFKKQLKKAKIISFYFSKYLEYLDNNLNQKISQEDGYKISAFHQHGYTDNFQSVIRKNEINLDTFLIFVENLRNYTGRNIEIMQQYEAQLKSGKEELDKQHFLLQQDVDILKKYVKLFYRLKLKISLWGKPGDVCQ